MTDLEERFRTGLRQAVADQPRLGPIDIDEVIARGEAGAGVPVRRRPPRWLAAAAALALVAGVGVASGLGRAPAPATPAVPAPVASPSDELGPPPTLGETLSGTWWAVAEVGGESVPMTGTAEDDFLMVKFEDGSATASDPCATIALDVRVAGTELAFTERAPMLKSCRTAEKDRHARFRTALGEVTAARIEGAERGRQLILAAADGTIVLRLVDVTAGLPGTQPEETDEPVASPRALVTVTCPSMPVEAEPAMECIPPGYRVVTCAPIAGQEPAVTCAVRAKDEEAVESEPAKTTPVRLRNDSGVDFDRYLVVFPDGMRVDMDTELSDGETTSYVDTAGAYRDAWVEVVVGGRTYRFEPDHEGEKLLGPGRYTYVLDIVGSKLRITLEQKD